MDRQLRAVRGAARKWSRARPNDAGTAPVLAVAAVSDGSPLGTWWHRWHRTVILTALALLAAAGVVVALLMTSPGLLQDAATPHGSSSVGSGAGVCAQCPAGSYCSAVPVGSASSPACVQCNTNSQCGGGVATTCVHGRCAHTCASNEQCPADAGHCVANACQPCATSSDCSGNASGSECWNGQCVQCLDDSMCPAGQSCNIQSQTCAAVCGTEAAPMEACPDGTCSMSSQSCVDGTCACQVDSGAACTSSSDCSSGEICGSAGTCVAAVSGCVRGEVCVSGGICAPTSCPSGTVCLTGTSELGNRGMCVECLSSSNCAGSAVCCLPQDGATCVGAAANTCVECLSAAGCLDDGMTCNLTLHTCTAAKCMDPAPSSDGGVSPMRLLLLESGTLPKIHKCLSQRLCPAGSPSSDCAGWGLCTPDDTGMQWVLRNSGLSVNFMALLVPTSTSDQAAAALAHSPTSQAIAVVPAPGSPSPGFYLQADVSGTKVYLAQGDGDKQLMTWVEGTTSAQMFVSEWVATPGTCQDTSA